MAEVFNREQGRLAVVSLLVIAAGVLVVALIWTRTVMIPFVLAIFGYVLIMPLMDLFMVRFRQPKWVALVVSLLAVLVVAGLAAFLLTGAVQTVVSRASEYQAKVVEIARLMEGQARSLAERFDQDVSAWFEEFPISSVVSRSMTTVMGSLGRAAGILGTTAMTVVFMLFFLAGHRPGDKRNATVDGVVRMIRRYVGTLAMTSAATGILTAIICAIFGVPFALVFGILAFLLNFIPTIGSVVAVILPIPIALIEFRAFWPVLGLVIALGAVQVVIGNIIQPRLMGKGLDLHPVTIILCLGFWGLVWGILGMLLSAPLTATLRLILDQFETTRPAANLLAGRFGEEEEAAAAPG
jgi:AI-2 transport protein TqsA